MPPARRLNITDITEAVCGVCLDAHTSLVCVDEIHNLNLATRNGAEASPQVLLQAHPDHLRLRRDQRRAGRAAIRHPRRADRSRFGMVRTGPFPRDAQWSGLIAALEYSLRLHRHVPGPLPAWISTCTSGPAARSAHCCG